MQRRALVAVALLQVVGFPAGAAEFIPSWNVEGVWSSNVFRSTDERSDFSVRTGPSLRVREPKGDLTYDLKYWLRYEGFAQIEGVSGVDSTDQYLSGRGNWRINPTSRLEVSNEFAYTTYINSLLQNPDLVSTVAFGRERITTNSARAAFTHDFGRLWSMTASVANVFYDYQNEDQADTTATTGTVQLTRAFSPRLTAGMGGQYQRQDFDASDISPSRGTTLYQGFGVLNYVISPTWRISARAGPAFVQPDSIETGDVTVSSYYAVDPATCPKNNDGTPVYIQFPQSAADLCQPAYYRTASGLRVAQVAEAPRGDVTHVPFVGDGDVGNSLNYFGTLSISKEWRRWNAILEYSRSASNSSGLNGSSVLDQFRGTVNWVPSRLWNVSITGIYAKQTALNKSRQSEVALMPEIDDQTIPGAVAVFGLPFQVDSGQEISNEIDITTLYFTLTGTRRVSRNLSLIGSATYWQQESNGFVQDTQLRDIEFTVGFTWEFDPIPL